MRMLPRVSSPEEREMPEGEPVSIGMDEEAEVMDGMEEEEAIGMDGVLELMAVEEEVEFMEDIMLLPVPVAMGIMLEEDMELELPRRAGPAIPPRRPDRGPSREPVTEPTAWDRGSELELPLIVGDEPD